MGETIAHVATLDKRTVASNRQWARRAVRKIRNAYWEPDERRAVTPAEAARLSILTGVKELVRRELIAVSPGLAEGAFVRWGFMVPLCYEGELFHSGDDRDELERCAPRPPNSRGSVLSREQMARNLIVNPSALDDFARRVESPLASPSFPLRRPVPLLGFVAHLGGRNGTLYSLHPERNFPEAARERLEHRPDTRRPGYSVSVLIPRKRS